MIDVTDAIPAATLVVMRDAASGPPDLLIVERAKAMAFAPGALVFPGGRIDPGDEALAATLPPIEQAPARVAAIRETIEEVGVSIGLDPVPTPGQLASIRRALHDGQPFGAALAAVDATLDLNALAYFARWRPDHQRVRTFDTHFFLARLPAGAGTATVDATENVRLLWATAHQLLADADASRVTIIYPTRRNLERLAQFTTIDDALSDTAAREVRTITPFIEDRDGVRHLCIPDDFGYPVMAEPVDRAVRG